MTNKTSLTQNQIRQMSWTELVRFYHRPTTSAAMRKAIEREAKRSGYEFDEIIARHGQPEHDE